MEIKQTDNPIKAFQEAVVLVEKLDFQNMSEYKIENNTIARSIYFGSNQEFYEKKEKQSIKISIKITPIHKSKEKHENNPEN